MQFRIHMYVLMSKLVCIKLKHWHRQCCSSHSNMSLSISCQMEMSKYQTEKTHGGEMSVENI